jgi:SagB-type dehydrogenase family enzyme
MNNRIGLAVSLVLVSSFIFTAGCGEAGEVPSASASGEIITLPEPRYDSDVSLEQALLTRRSVRSFKDGALTLKELGQLLWAAQGVTDPSGKRTAPSAGALYPLEVYVVVGYVEGVSAGIYKYVPESHTLARVSEGDQRQALSQAAMSQSSVRQGAIDIVITAVYERVTSKYGDRGIRFVHLEAGHAAQNVCLQVVALKLGAVTVGAFDDASVKTVLGAAADEEPLYILPVGRTDN